MEEVSKGGHGSSHSHQNNASETLPTSNDPSLTFEINELRQQLESKEIEIKRKDKENSTLHKDINRLHQDISTTHEELRVTKERNEQLQQALISARMNHDRNKDEKALQQAKGKIKELEDVVSDAVQRYSQVESELEKVNKSNRELSYEIHSKTETIKNLKEIESLIRAELADISTSNKVVGKLNEELKKDVADLRKEIATQQQNEVNLRNDLKAKDSKLKEQISENQALKEDIKKIQTHLGIRNETNALLRSELEGQSSRVILSDSEMERFRRIEQENANLQSRTLDLIKSLDLHMQLQRRAEDEAAKAKTQYSETFSHLQGLLKEMDQFKISSGEELKALKQAHRDLSKLRKENVDLHRRIDDLRQNGSSTLESNVQVNENDSTTTEIKQKKTLSEESNRALRSRVSFLLEQLQIVANQSVQYEEEKRMLQSQITALHRTNLTLRQKIIDFQRILSEYDGRDVIGGAEDLPGGLPSSMEALIERAVFDMSCAFLNGEASQMKTDISRPTTVLQQGPFRPMMHEDGSFSITLSSDNISSNDSSAAIASAQDVLEHLQLPAFLRFVQNKPEAKTTSLFVDKITSILNFYIRGTQELLNQIGESRMANAKMIAHREVSQEVVEKAKMFSTKERVCKQQSVMKYVREMMRFSDFSVILNEIGNDAKVKIDSTHECTAILSQLISLNDDMLSMLKQSGVKAGPVGGFELRLQELQLDDESVYGVTGLLQGNGGHHQPLEDRNNDGQGLPALKVTNYSTNSMLQLEKSYFDKVLLLNLRGNMITDIGCKALSSLVENSAELRMLDLRDNYISSTGRQILFESLRHNPSVVFVSSKGDSTRLEGHREIIGQNQNPTSNNNNTQGFRDFERLVGVVKYPLRIDIRNNQSEAQLIELQVKVSHYGMQIPKSNQSDKATIEDQNIQGLKSVPKQGRIPVLIQTNNSIRPISAPSRGSQVVLSDQTLRGNMSTRRVDDSQDEDQFISDILRRKFQVGDGSDSDDDKDAKKNGDHGTSILDLIKMSSVTMGKDAPSFQLNMNKNDVGKMLDEQIRSIEESSALMIRQRDVNTTSQVFGSTMNVSNNTTGSNNNSNNTTSSNAVINNTNINTNPADWVDKKMKMKEMTSSSSRPPKRAQTTPHSSRDGGIATRSMQVSQNTRSSSNIGIASNASNSNQLNSSIIREKLQVAKWKDSQGFSATAPVMRSDSPGKSIKVAPSKDSLRQRGNDVKSFIDNINRLNPSVLF